MEGFFFCSALNLLAREQERSLIKAVGMRVQAYLYQLRAVKIWPDLPQFSLGLTFWPSN